MGSQAPHPAPRTPHTGRQRGGTVLRLKLRRRGLHNPDSSRRYQGTEAAGAEGGRGSRGGAGEGGGGGLREGGGGGSGGSGAGEGGGRGLTASFTAGANGCRKRQQKRRQINTQQLLIPKAPQNLLSPHSDLCYLKFNDSFHFLHFTRLRGLHARWPVPSSP